jgi:hypothetical protein
MEKNLKEEIERFKKLSRIHERSFLDKASDFFDKIIKGLADAIDYEGLKEKIKSGGKSDSKYDSSYITSDDKFYKKILERIDAPVTKENMKFLYAWRQSEGGRARNNPFNTTQRYEGATDYNWVGVKHYLTPEDGLEATVKTILNGRYKCIVDGLRNDIGAENISKCYSDLKTWGTGTLVNTVVSRYNSGAQPNVPPIA